MKHSYDVIIVGSGMAGLAAADVLAGRQLSVLIVDDNAHTGGQLLRRSSWPESKVQKKPIRWYDPVKRQGLRLLDRMSTIRVDRLQASQVLGVFPGPSLVVETGPGAMVDIQASCLLLATGARERFLPFKGWTLPGVISTGGAQILMKSHGILPGRETLIGGTGPLQLVLAAEILRNRGQVSAILDHQRWQTKLGILPLLHHQWPRLVEGAVYLSAILGRKVPWRQGTGIVEATGKRSLETVVAARLNSRGEPIPGTRTVYSTGTLAVGYGFVPNIELAVQAGCETLYDPDRGGWVIRVGHGLETSVSGVFAAGEVTGIAGGGKSLIEGRIAGFSILETLGYKSQDPSDVSRERLEVLRDRETAYGIFLNRLCHVPLSWFANINDETIVCRCEEITMGEIRRAMAHGFLTPGAIKKATRCTMGRCQGRICGPVLSDIIAGLTGRPPGSMGPVSARFPVKTVSLKTLAALEPDRQSAGSGQGSVFQGSKENNHGPG